VDAVKVYQPNQTHYNISISSMMHTPGNPSPHCLGNPEMSKALFLRKRLQAQMLLPVAIQQTKFMQASDTHVPYKKVTCRGLLSLSM
jgi:hypothetical protein